MDVLVFTFVVSFGLFPHTEAAFTFERLIHYDNVEVINSSIAQTEGSDIRDCAHACAYEAACFLYYYDPVTTSCKLFPHVSSLPHWSNGTYTPGSRYYQLWLPVEDWCPVEGGWTNVEHVFMCFKVSEDSLAWQGAREACQSEGGDLIVLSEPWMQTAIMTVDTVEDIGKKGFSLWIGLTDTADEGKFKWVDGSVFSSDDPFWDYYQPNGGSLENCGSLLNGNISDSDCNADKRFICQKLL